MWSNKTIDNQAKVDGDMLAWVHVGWDVLCVHTCFIFELPMHLLYFNARLKKLAPRTPTHTLITEILEAML
jgi:hypothetical protein